jgi:hypothetical protein
MDIGPSVRFSQNSHYCSRAKFTWCGCKHKAVESRIAASEGKRCQARSFLKRSVSSTWRIGRATALAFARQGAGCRRRRER